MKTHLSLIVALIAALPHALSAQEATPAPEIDNFVSQLTRAEVRQQTLEAIRSGQVARNDADMKRLADVGFVGSKTRAQVAAELRQARAEGLVQQGEGEPVGMALARQARATLMASNR